MKRSRQNSSKNGQSADDIAAPANSLPEKKKKLLDDTALTVTLSSLDKADSLSLSDDKLCCWGERDMGFCLARASHAVDSGKYFWECEVLDPSTRKVSEKDAEIRSPSGEGHVRIGWATDAAAVTAPVGYDVFGFGYRDIKGSTVHKSTRIDNYGAEFGVGDVIGCHISLNRADSSRNEVRFFKNGIDQGTAFKGDIIQGVYYPAVSLYKDACVRANFGPFFIYPYNYVQKIAARQETQTDGAEAAANNFSAQYYAGTLPVSELQPMSIDQKKIHSEYISQRRVFYYARDKDVAVDSNYNK